MTVEAVTAQEDIQAQLRDPTTATPWRTSTMYTSDEVDALVTAALAAALAAGTYAPTITDAPAGWTLTAPGGFVYTRIGKAVTITGHIHVVGDLLAARFTGGGDFTLPASLTGVRGDGVGAGFYEDGAPRGATFKLNDDGDGFTIDAFDITYDFSTDIRFTFTFYTP